MQSRAPYGHANPPPWHGGIPKRDPRNREKSSSRLWSQGDSIAPAQEYSLVRWTEAIPLGPGLSAFRYSLKKGRSTLSRESRPL
jgi:hypothetical protein